MLEDQYDVMLQKFSDDAQSGAGQYDVYLLDDPWVPQLAAADVLEDLGAGGIDGENADWLKPMIDMGYWPPREGPRVAGFEDADPALIAVPFIGDLQTMTYRNDVYTDGPPKTWDELIAKGKEGVAEGTIKYPVVFRGVASNPIVTSWYPVFLSYGGQFFDDNWNVTFNDENGKASADFFVTTMKQNAPPGVVEFDSNEEGAAILGGEAGAIIQYTGNALKADDPAESKEVGKLDFAVVPKQKEAIGQMGILSRRFPSRLPTRKPRSRSSSGTHRPRSSRSSTRRAPFRSPALGSTYGSGNRLIPVTLEQVDAGSVPRPRTPDWAKVEEPRHRAQQSAPRPVPVAVKRSTQPPRRSRTTSRSRATTTDASRRAPRSACRGQGSRGLCPTC
jgi:multiple sugar transport system substrate-binding protein